MSITIISSYEIGMHAIGKERRIYP
jgi:hypothetical protein